MAQDAIAPEIRKIERQFDTAYRANPLLNVSRPTATWMLLSVFEDAVAKPVLRGDPPDLQKSSLRENLLINALKHPLLWLRECPVGRLQARYTDQMYKDAYDLLMLGGRYDAIETVFVFASRGQSNLTLEGRKVLPVPLVEADDARYYAYNRFIAAGDDIPPPSIEFLNTFARIAERVTVTSEGFSLKLDPKFVDQAMSSYGPTLDQRFHLPEDWRTTRYSFRDLKRIYLVLSALASIQFQGRLVAVGQGASRFGFNNSVLRFGCDELQSRVRRYSGLDGATIAAVLGDLSYGSRGVTRPDPALQPLIPVGSDAILISPSLILCSSPERNHCMLLNSIPEEREVYSGLVDRKEALMREEILRVSDSKRYRPFFGGVAGRKELPNIDLALIDDDRRLVLMLELKWFIGPDEVREVLNRSDDLKKGVSQAKLLKAAFSDGTDVVQKTLKVASDFKCKCALVSHNWIGGHSVQDDEVPIITLRHLQAALKKAESLADVTAWLAERRYLPIEGVHFRVVSNEVSIGENSTVWWDIEPLISGTYDAVASL
jgi:hypothetical protein